MPKQRGLLDKVLNLRLAEPVLYTDAGKNGHVGLNSQYFILILYTRVRA